MAVPKLELVQLARGAPAAPPSPARKPGWLKVRAPGGPTYLELKGLMRELGLHTVCEEARCPNIGECWEHKAATFMILGDVCTRNCTYCAVTHGTPKPDDPGEPARLAEAVARMGLQHVVITSVDRDDLPNAGAEAFAACVREIRARMPETSVEATPAIVSDTWQLYIPPIGMDWGSAQVPAPASDPSRVSLNELSVTARSAKVFCTRTV